MHQSIKHLEFFFWKPKVTTVKTFLSGYGTSVQELFLTSHSDRGLVHRSLFWACDEKCKKFLSTVVGDGWRSAPTLPFTPFPVIVLDPATTTSSAPVVRLRVGLEPPPCAGGIPGVSIDRVPVSLPWWFDPTKTLSSETFIPSVAFLTTSRLPTPLGPS